MLMCYLKWLKFCISILWLSLLEFSLLLLYSNLHKKTGIQLSSKKLLHKCLFKIPLRREIDNATSYFLISSKNFK